MSKARSTKVTVAGFTFRRLGFDAFPLYAHYFRNAGHEDLTHYGSFPLMIRNRFGYREIDGYLFVFRYWRDDDGDRIDAVGLPINERGERLDIDTTREALEGFNGRAAGRILYLHPALAARDPTAHVAREGVREYVYDNGTLARLEGGTFANLRKTVNRFGKQNDVEMVPYERRLRGEAQAIYERWCAVEGAKYGRLWDGKLFADLLDNHGVMDHHLFLVRDRKADAFIGLFDAVRVAPTLAMGVLRKHDSRYPGIAQFCQVYLARHLDALGCTYLNDGDDADKPGLAQLKSAFHPVSVFRPLSHRFGR